MDIFNTQTALISHINAAKLAFKTVKPYAGEVKDATKLTSIKPAALVMLMEGKPAGDKPYTGIDVLVVTESRALDKETNHDNNIKLASDLAALFDASPAFELNGSVYRIDNEQTYIRNLMQDARFTIVAVSIIINEIY